MWIARLRALVRRLLAPRRTERDLHEDVQGYAEMLADELRASGLPPDEARRRAGVALGGVESVKESARDARTGAGLELAWRDVRMALRGLRRAPGFALTAIATIGLGIGVNTTLFTVIDGAIFKPLPYERSEELVTLAHRTAQVTFLGGLTWEELAQWREAPNLFQGVETYTGGRARQWRERGESIVVGGLSRRLPTLLGVPPAAGRLFTADEARDGAPVLLIADELWASAFGRSRDAIGATMTLDDRQITIVGVLPPSFRYLFRGSPTPTLAWGPLSESATPDGAVSAIMRLESALTLEAAHERALAVAARIQEPRPEKEPWTPQLLSIDTMRHAGREQLQTPMLMLLGTAGLVLLVACVNVANLLLTRGASRRDELALRVALGASRGRLLRLLATEGAMIAALGGAAAMLLAIWTLDALVAYIPGRLGQTMFQVSAPTVDGRAIAFALGASSVVALLAAVWPAVSASRPALGASMSGGHQVAGDSPNRRRLGRVLQAVQVGLAFVLAMTAALFATSFAKVLSEDFGFDARGLGAARFDVRYSTPDAGRPAEPPIAVGRAAIADAVTRVRATPGIRAAAIGNTPASALTGNMYRRGESDSIALLDVCIVGPGYFETAGIRLVAGRDFGPEDRPGTPPVAIIDEEGARRIFGSESPIGQRYNRRPDGPETTIIGIVTTVKRWSFVQRHSRVQVYLPASQQSPYPFIVFRTDRDLAAIAPVVHAALAADPAISVRSIGAATDYYETMETFATPRFYLVLVSMFAGLALVTTAVGLYGLLAHAVGQRRREIGVRVTLGATPRQVCGLVLREALAPVLVGIALGALATWWTTDLIASLLYGIGPRDPRALALAAAALVAVAVAAAIVPIRRATGVDPVYALRLE